MGIKACICTSMKKITIIVQGTTLITHRQSLTAVSLAHVDLSPHRRSKTANVSRRTAHMSIQKVAMLIAIKRNTLVAGTCPNRKEKRLHKSPHISFPHSTTQTKPCSWGMDCRKWSCERTHPSDRTPLCPNEDHCDNKLCCYLHPVKRTKPSESIAVVSAASKRPEDYLSQTQNCSNGNDDAEVQIPISEVMAIFLRSKALSDIRKLEKTHLIKITIFSAQPRQHTNDQQNDDEHNYIRVAGSRACVRSAQGFIENFLTRLYEQEKHFPCDSWNIEKKIVELIRVRLRKLLHSDACKATGWIKLYTTAKQTNTAPRVTISLVAWNEEAAHELAGQCQDIVEGHVVWKPPTDEYHSMVGALLIRKTPHIDEFRQRWDTDIRFDKATSTVTICARSKPMADDIKQALLSLAKEQRGTGHDVSEFIDIEPKIRRFVNQNISGILNEARSRKVHVNFGNRRGLGLTGSSEVVTALREKLNYIIKNIQKRIITHRLQLSAVESKLMRTDGYEMANRVQHETNTFIRDGQVDMTTTSSLSANEKENSSPRITVVNSRGQTIIVTKGDITNARNVDAIVKAANGLLYPADDVDKAIANAAGSAFDQECKQLIAQNRGLPISAGSVVKTTAGNLPFQCVIHAIGPQHVDDHHRKRSLLFSSILKSLQLAENQGCTSVALLAVSAETYGFSLVDCTNIVVRAVKQFFADLSQSNMVKVILLNADDATCDSFVREVVIDHSDAVLDNNNDLIDHESFPLAAKWCWQDDRDEKISSSVSIRKIETAFQQYLQTFTPSDLKLGATNLRSGTTVHYSIHFLPDLKQVLASNPTALNGRLVCGHQMRMDTAYRRDIIRYPVVAEHNQVQPIHYDPKPLDSYHTEIAIAQEYWNIIGITETAIELAQSAIRAAIESAKVTELFCVNLNKDLDNHKKELSKIAAEEHVQINFEEESSGQLPMVLIGFKPNTTEVKLKFAFYVQNILKLQVENDDELRLPKEWGEQKEECKLVDISCTDACFVRIENRMRETLSNVKIKKIERVQNVRMWNHYAFRRRELQKELRHMPYLQIEMELFHGTSKTLPSEVYHGEYGFDMTFSTAGMWGVGTYFAKNASYSCGQYAYQLSNGKRQVFLAQVLTGDVHTCNSDRSLRRPPKKNETVSGLRYNSVSGHTGGSNVYIVYENRVAYPAYLITFTP